MIKHYFEQMDRTFFALSDPTRRAIVNRIAARGKGSVLELARPFDLSLPSISKHLKLLEKTNLMARKQQGRNHYLKLKYPAICEAIEWLSTYQSSWQRLSRLSDETLLLKQ